MIEVLLRAAILFALKRRKMKGIDKRLILLKSVFRYPFVQGTPCPPETTPVGAQTAPRQAFPERPRGE